MLSLLFLYVSYLGYLVFHVPKFNIIIKIIIIIRKNLTWVD